MATCASRSASGSQSSTTSVNVVTPSAVVLISSISDRSWIGIAVLAVIPDTSQAITAHAAATILVGVPSRSTSAERQPATGPGPVRAAQHDAAPPVVVGEVAQRQPGAGGVGAYDAGVVVSVVAQHLPPGGHPQQLRN